MTEILLVILLLFCGVILAGVLFVGIVIGHSRRESAAQSVVIDSLGKQLENVRNSQENFSRNVESNLKTGQENISKFLENSQGRLKDLGEQIGRMNRTSEQMAKIGEDIQKLQNIFMNPKQRGQFGEMSLLRLLEDVLPKESFNVQHQFRNGKIADAIVKMSDNLVVIDAKFPLPAFEQIVKAQDQQDKSRFRRQFQKDVSNHIDKIAQSYILPDEGTLDFALMYIPAENVYYETVVKQDHDRADLLNYALDRKVIPVSPNLLYTYLMTVVMGLKGLQVEQQAARILTGLKKLRIGVDSFCQTYNLVGKHMRNALSQYDEGQKRLDRFSVEFDQLHLEDKNGNIDE